MSDILKDLLANGYMPEINKEDDFRPINGKYICRLDTAGRVKGESKKDGSPYDFYSVSVQVVEVVEGDKATNRFLKLRYNADTEGMKKLLNDLFTAGITADTSSQEAFDAALSGLKDNTLNIRAWVWSPEKDRDGNQIAEENRKEYQQLRVVNSFKGKGKSTVAKSDIPF
jgi:hypothetical protein